MIEIVVCMYILNLKVLSVYFSYSYFNINNISNTMSYIYVYVRERQGKVVPVLN
jgi:hypothetical protein